MLVWGAAVLLAVLGVGLAVLPLETPMFTRLLSDRFSQTSHLGLTSPETAALAEQVRAFVVSGDGELPAEYNGSAAFDTQAVSHLEDVRDVLTGAHIAIALLALLALAGTAVAWRAGRLGFVGDALVRSGAILIAAILAIGLAALVDFDTFFALFHGVFFAAGTWTFPADSLLISLFPEQFWVTAALMWGMFGIVVGTAFSLLGAVIKRHISMPLTEPAD